MAFVLSDVIPWGRSFDEYVAMFNLCDGDLDGRILGCGDGPASFNAGLTARGGVVRSIDPLYECPPAAIRERIREVAPTVMHQVRANASSFVWRNIASVEELERVRLLAMDEFLADYETPDATARYISASLPCLPFGDADFDLALCSHFLFLYSGQYTAAFHLESIREMCRVAREARVFPLIELDLSRSRHLDSVMTALEDTGYRATIARVPYEFQRGGNEMLVVRRMKAA